MSWIATPRHEGEQGVALRSGRASVLPGGDRARWTVPDADSHSDRVSAAPIWHQRDPQQSPSHTGRSKKGPVVTAHAEERLVLVKNFPHRSMAESGQQLLRREHIHAVLQSSDRAGTGTIDGCDLYVKAKDARRALELLESFYDNA